MQRGIPILALAFCALTGGPAVAQSTCSYPWTPDHDYYGKFEVGRFYMSPYNEVVEVLGEVSGRLYLRNVKGFYCKTKPKYDLVYVRGAEFLTADCTIPAKADVQSFGKLPDGCYVPSTVVTVVDGKLTISTR